MSNAFASILYTSLFFMEDITNCKPIIENVHLADSFRNLFLFRLLLFFLDKFVLFLLWNGFKAVFYLQVAGLFPFNITKNLT